MEEKADLARRREERRTEEEGIAVAAEIEARAGSKEEEAPAIEEFSRFWAGSGSPEGGEMDGGGRNTSHPQILDILALALGEEDDALVLGLQNRASTPLPPDKWRRKQIWLAGERTSFVETGHDRGDLAGGISVELSWSVAGEGEGSRHRAREAVSGKNGRSTSFRDFQGAGRDPCSASQEPT